MCADFKNDKTLFKCEKTMKLFNTTACCGSCKKSVVLGSYNINLLLLLVVRRC